MKKLLSLLLAAVLIMSLFSVNAFAATGDSKAVGDKPFVESEPNHEFYLADEIFHDYTIMGELSDIDIDVYAFDLYHDAEISFACLADYSVLTMLLYNENEECIAIAESEYYNGYWADGLTIELDYGVYYIVLINSEEDWYDNDYTFYFFVENGWYVDEYGREYLFKDGQHRIGWIYVSTEGWYYTGADGVQLYGWQYIGGVWYYFDYYNLGVMSTGWQNIDGTWYYFNSDGAMQTGWVYDGVSWYYMNSSGAMQTGWIYDGANWYYLNEGGAMVTGWQYIGGSWYYLNSSGAMATGWLYDGVSWYYLNSGGAMQIGWQYIDGTWYYLYDSGAMATNIYISGGYIDASGAWRA